MHRLATCQDEVSSLRRALSSKTVRLWCAERLWLRLCCSWECVCLSSHKCFALKFLKTFLQCMGSIQSSPRVTARRSKKNVWQSKVAATSTSESLPCAQTKAIKHTSLTQAQCACCFFSFSYWFLQTLPLRHHLSVWEAKTTTKTTLNFLPRILSLFEIFLFLFLCNSPVSCRNSSIPKLCWHRKRPGEWNESRKAIKLLKLIFSSCLNAKWIINGI